MQEIGFSLYTEMLNQAVRSLKAGKEPDLAAPLGVTTEINLHTPALLPEDYCGDVHERLVLYKRLANCESLDDLERLREELVDRFGLPPQSTQALLESHRLRILGKPLGIAKIDASADVIQVQFVPNPPVEAQRIIHLIKSKRNYRLAGPDRLRITGQLPLVTERVGVIKGLLKELT